MRPIDLAHEEAGRAEPEAADWVRRARLGELGAFEWLVRRHERMVIRTALRLLGRLDLAEDAAQETFLRLHRYIGRFDVSRELGPWLHRMAVNVCHDIASRSRRRVLVCLDEVESAALGRAAGSQTEIEEDVTRNQQRRLVQAALQTLPAKERAAIVLRDIEGLPSPEVARILGSSEGTVRSQVASARLKIKRFIEARQERKP